MTTSSAISVTHQKRDFPGRDRPLILPQMPNPNFIILAIANQSPAVRTEGDGAVSGQLKRRICGEFRRVDRPQANRPVAAAPGQHFPVGTDRNAGLRSPGSGEGGE